MNDAILGLLSFCLISILYLASLMRGLREQISSLKQKVIKFYLDRKLMTRLINKLINKDAIQVIMYDVIEYFMLYDIIIYNLDSNNPKNDIVDYIENNLSSIIERLSDKKLLKIQIDKVGKLEQKIIVQYFDSYTKKLIIYVEETNDKLSDNDLDMLSEAVTPILQLAII